MFTSAPVSTCRACQLTCVLHSILNKNGKDEVQLVHAPQVHVNGWHCLALSSSGQVYAWGGNEYNQVQFIEGPVIAKDPLS